MTLADLIEQAVSANPSEPPEKIAHRVVSQTIALDDLEKTLTFEDYKTAARALGYGENEPFTGTDFARELKDPRSGEEVFSEGNGRARARARIKRYCKAAGLLLSALLVSCAGAVTSLQDATEAAHRLAIETEATCSSAIKSIELAQAQTDLICSLPIPVPENAELVKTACDPDYLTDAKASAMLVCEGVKRARAQLDKLTKK